MTTQECYEAIRAYFNQPGAVLASTHNSCRYRTEEGAKCAVGCLIPDELYSPALEGSGIDKDWLISHREIAEIVVGVDLKFLRSAQVLHDQVAKDARSFVAGLDILANAFGLETWWLGMDRLLDGTVRQVEIVRWVTFS